ncbi:hypothetical protein T265_11539 [Opisthorchis viverrini]|uniref:Uncharacterized protein n=1 Tax=Opisthorchis viverrini TaxID=6198 RepID=A0A074ZX68_OPIVI|nr:hypothetical protein T265_11539 [Opisthorchis viverrini]KER19774.1 hypothetical protein T265_11539 [Opisthorchis viverrini]
MYLYKCQHGKQKYTSKDLFKRGRVISMSDVQNSCRGLKWINKKKQCADIQLRTNLVLTAKDDLLPLNTLQKAVPFFR